MNVIYNFIIKILKNIAVMENFAKYNQSMTIRSEFNRFPAISEKQQQNSQRQDNNKSQPFNKRLHELEGSIRLLQKKYKQNLKQGFDHKIKSFRLQAVIQRKALKATIQQTKRQIQQQQLKRKATRAKSQKQRQGQSLIQINQRIQQKRKRARSKAERQRKQITQKIKEQQEKSSILNKQIHDKIIQETRSNDRKKKYFETLKKIKYQTYVQNEKKQFVEKLVHNSQVLKKLKGQLSDITKSYRQKQDVPYISQSQTLTPFITI